MSLCQSSAESATMVFQARAASGTTKLPPMTTPDRSVHQARGDSCDPIGSGEKLVSTLDSDSSQHVPSTSTKREHP